MAALSACGTGTPAESTAPQPTPTLDGHHQTRLPDRRGRPATHPAPQTRNWFDLDVGDCLTVLPRIDLGDVAVPVADCATPTSPRYSCARRSR